MVYHRIIYKLMMLNLLKVFYFTHCCLSAISRLIRDQTPFDVCMHLYVTMGLAIKAYMVQP